MRMSKERENKITNQFLINLAFGLIYFMLAFMAYNGYSDRVIKFNMDSRPYIMAISATIGTVMLIMWNSNQKKVWLRSWGVFFMGTSLMGLWLVAFRALNKLRLAERALLWAVGGYLVLNLVVYLVRINRRPKKAFKKERK